MFLFRTSRIAEDVSLNQRSSIFRKKAACEAAKVHPPGPRAVALFGSVSEETALDLIRSVNALGPQERVRNGGPDTTGARKEALCPALSRWHRRFRSLSTGTERP